MENWIWLQNKLYPQYQRTFMSMMEYTPDDPERNFCVAEFYKEFSFDETVK